MYLIWSVIWCASLTCSLAGTCEQFKKWILTYKNLVNWARNTPIADQRTIYRTKRKRHWSTDKDTCKIWKCRLGSLSLYLLAWKGFIRHFHTFIVLLCELYPANIQMWTTICPPAKCHLNGVSLGGRKGIKIKYWLGMKQYIQDAW